MVNQLEHGNSKHSGRRQVCLTQIQAMVKQTCWISSTHQGITNTCTHPCMPIKGVICNAVQCNARVFMAMVVVVVARHEQASSQACELSGQGINVESEKREPMQHLLWTMELKSEERWMGTHLSKLMQITPSTCECDGTLVLVLPFPFPSPLMDDAGSDAWSSHKSHLCWSHKLMNGAFVRERKKLLNAHNG